MSAASPPRAAPESYAPVPVYDWSGIGRRGNSRYPLIHSHDTCRAARKLTPAGVPCLLGLLLALSWPLAAKAERSHDLGNYILHYNAMPTPALNATVAAVYDIRRAPDLGILNVAVARKRSGGAALPVAAMVSALVTRTDGRVAALAMREIRDGAAVYYIGEFEIRTREPLRFRLSVSPERATPPYHLEFEKQFMVE